MTTHSRRIDHLVLAVHNLDAAADFYRRLGFQVGPRNRHPWGTENRLIQFKTSFLELITVADTAGIPPHAPRSFSFGEYVREYLTEGEGLAMFALDSADATADAAEYTRRGISDFAPFSFERSGRSAAGDPTHVAFTLAFAIDDRLPNACFFVCQQHHPESFWSPALAVHRNGATNVIGARLEVVHPHEHIEFLRAFSGVDPAGGGRNYRLEHGGRLQVEPASGPPGFAGFSISVPDLEVVAALLSAENLSFRQAPPSIEVDQHQCFGARITFTATVS